MLKDQQFYLIYNHKQHVEYLVYLFPDKKSFLFWSGNAKFNSSVITESADTWELFKTNHPLCIAYKVREVTMLDLLTYKDPFRTFAKNYYIKFEKPLKFLKEFRGREL